MNISGNYNTHEREIYIVKRILDATNIRYTNVEKCLNADECDVLVYIENHQTPISVEIKEENYNRFNRYGDLGIDYLSAFQFKNSSSSNIWYGVRPASADLLMDFENSIDILKMGKIYYSKADLWLFYCLDDADDLYYHSWFLGTDMVSDEFKDYLRNNCLFAVNNKPNTQMSRHDHHESAVFYINKNDDFLVSLQILDIREKLREWGYL